MRQSGSELVSRVLICSHEKLILRIDFIFCPNIQNRLSNYLWSKYWIWLLCIILQIIFILTTHGILIYVYVVAPLREAKLLIYIYHSISKFFGRFLVNNMPNLCHEIKDNGTNDVDSLLVRRFRDFMFLKISTMTVSLIEQDEMECWRSACKPLFLVLVHFAVFHFDANDFPTKTRQY